MSDTVTLFTAEPVSLLFLAGPPDEREPGRDVVYTQLDGKVIARRALADADDRSQFFALGHVLPLMYVAWEADPGIQAQLFALTPDESEAWKTAQSMDAHYLGTVVRAKEFRVHPESLYDEAVDHFAAILSGKCVEPIEQMMKRLA